MPNESAQKSIAPNRVQIEYEVERYGAQKMVQLPFVVGVMADLSGKSLQKQPALAERHFEEVSRGTFDAYMETLRPRAVMDVKDTQTDGGRLSIALEFKSMADFAPDAVAARVPELNKLLRARTLLKNLIDDMNGKSDAEAMVVEALKDLPFLQALAAGAKSTEG
ncbi:type VI secretion system contractile sheath small subunit [Niveispirillum sp. KHB5.9]|uniref:type VI secretion system contractile sheath small subunit n=1 Tax=Niveispirillum sp. KHB5.9 TaxID=3400269 RepID=UPI003A89A041